MALEEGRYFRGAMTDKRHEADGLAAYCQRFLSSGVWDLGDNLKVSAASGLTVTVSYGHALINGYPYGVVDNGTGQLQAPADTADTQPRIDRVVVRADAAALRVYAYVKKGSPATSPSAPTLTRSDDVYEISLARILVPAGVDQIVSAYITDERSDEVACGIVRNRMGVSGPMASQTNNISVFDSADGQKIKDGGISLDNIWHTRNINPVPKVSDNRPGVTKLFRRDEDSQYNVQTYWDGARWVLKGYYDDDYHADCFVGRAGYADSAGVANYPAFGQGGCIDISGQVLTQPRNTGFYMGFNCINAPANGWWYYIWLRHNDIYQVVIAFPLNIGDYPQWRKEVNAEWSSWGTLGEWR